MMVLFPPCNLLFRKSCSFTLFLLYYDIEQILNLFNNQAFLCYGDFVLFSYKQIIYQTVTKKLPESYHQCHVASRRIVSSQGILEGHLFQETDPCEPVQQRESTSENRKQSSIIFYIEPYIITRRYALYLYSFWKSEYLHH